MKKSQNKNPKSKKKKKKKLIKEKDDESKIKKIEINKDLVFSNNAEILAKNIFEKIIANVFIIVNLKNIYKSVDITCSNYLIKGINSFLSSFYISHEKENNFQSIIKFNDNYLRSDINLDECNITQPSPPILDRWKIYQSKIIKANKKIQKLYGKRKSKFANQLIKPRQFTKNITLKKIIPKPQISDKKDDYLKVIEKDKMKRAALSLYDSFPSFPIPDLMNKPDLKLTKQQEEEIQILRENMILQGKEKRKLKENKRRSTMSIEPKESKENNKYEGQNIGVTANGEIIVIQSIDITKLKSEFLEINSKMKIEENKRKKLTKKISFNKLIEQNKKEIEIEKNKDDMNNNDYFNENSKHKTNRQRIIAGSSFSNFIPETGVNLKEGEEFKSGGIYFSYNNDRISFKQFEKTLNIFDKKNRENNELIEIKSENETKSGNNKFNDWNKYSNLSNDFTKSNNIPNLNLTTRKNFTLYNLKMSNSLPNLFQRNSPFLDLYKNNYNSNNNDSNNSKMNLTKYNNIHNNINNLIQTSSSFKDVFTLNNESIDKKFQKDNKILNATNFFINFNKNFQNFSKPKKVIMSLKKMQSFTSDIVKNNNWGSINSQERKTKYKNAMFTRNIIKKSLDKNILRVRSNENEIYLRKMNIVDRLTYRNIKNGIKDYKDLNNRIFYKNSKSVIK